MTTGERCGNEVLLGGSVHDGAVPWMLLGVRFLGWLCKILKGNEMILNDREITRLAKEHAMIEPFAEGAKRPGVISYGVTSFGYDMRVANEWTCFTGYPDQARDPKNPTSFKEIDWKLDAKVIQGGEFVLCRSVEYFRIPEDVVGVVVGKSTYARCGLIVNCTPMEPGWHGHLTIELHNASQHAIKVYANEGIAQVMFFRGERPHVTYADKGGKYQGQTGVTLGKVE
jgi:dCTP deaminase